MRKWLTLQEQDQRWAEQSILHFDRVLPNGDYEHWPQCQELYPHAHPALELQLEERGVRLHWALVLYKAAWFGLTQGAAAEAQDLVTASMEGRKTVLG